MTNELYNAYDVTHNLVLDSSTNCQFQEGTAVCAIQLVYFL